MRLFEEESSRRLLLPFSSPAFSSYYSPTPSLSNLPTVLLTLKRPAFKVARKRRKGACTKYIQRGLTSRFLSQQGYAPARGQLRARSQRRKTRYDLVPAGRSPHGARSSLVITKLPLWKIRSSRPRACFSLFSFLHRRRYPSSSTFRDRPPTVRPSLPPSRSPFSLDVIAKSATHYPILPPENQPARYHLSLSFSLSPYAEHTSSYSSSVFIPSRFVLPPTATPRPRRLAQVTAIGNFNARPVSLAERLHPAERLSRRGVASHNRCPNSGSTFYTCLPLRRWSSLYHELDIVHRNLFRNYIFIPILSLHGIGVLLLKCFNIFFLLLY